MTDSNEQETKRPLSLARPGGRLELKKPIDAGSGQVRQSFPHGRTKTVTVEVKKKRAVEPPRPGHPPAEAVAAPVAAPTPVVAPAPASAPAPIVQKVVAPVAPVVAAPVQPAPAPKPEPVVEAAPVAAPAAPEPVAEAPKAAAPVVEPPKVEAAPVVVAPAPRPVEPTRVLGPRPAARILTPPTTPSSLRRGGATVPRTLTEEERAARMKAVQSMVQGEAQRKQTEIELARRARELETERARDEEERRRHIEETSAAEAQIGRAHV